jgi:hypothetical protein
MPQTPLCRVRAASRTPPARRMRILVDRFIYQGFAMRQGDMRYPISPNARIPNDQDVGPGAGAEALSGVRSRSHFPRVSPAGPVHCRDHDRVLRFQLPPPRTVRDPRAPQHVTAADLVI